jgi:hypothetical protein
VACRFVLHIGGRARPLPLPLAAGCVAAGVSQGLVLPHCHSAFDSRPPDAARSHPDATWLCATGAFAAQADATKTCGNGKCWEEPKCKTRYTKYPCPCVPLLHKLPLLPTLQCWSVYHRMSGALHVTPEWRASCHQAAVARRAVRKIGVLQCPSTSAGAASRGTRMCLLQVVRPQLRVPEGQVRQVQGGDGHGAAQHAEHHHPVPRTDRCPTTRVTISWRSSATLNPPLACTPQVTIKGKKCFGKTPITYIAVSYGHGKGAPVCADNKCAPTARPFETRHASAPTPATAGCLFQLSLVTIQSSEVGAAAAGSTASSPTAATATTTPTATSSPSRQCVART